MRSESCTSTFDPQEPELTFLGQSAAPRSGKTVAPPASTSLIWEYKDRAWPFYSMLSEQLSHQGHDKVCRSPSSEHEQLHHQPFGQERLFPHHAPP